MVGTAIIESLPSINERKQAMKTASIVPLEVIKIDGRIDNSTIGIPYCWEYRDSLDAPEYIPTGSMVGCFGYCMASCIRRGEG